VKESTKNIAKMHGWRVDRTAHNWIYFTFYKPYVWIMVHAADIVEKLLGRFGISSTVFGMATARYHSKVVTLDDISKILTLDEDVIIGPDKTERIIPFQYANKIILKEPEFIAVMDCPCRLRRPDGCQPADVCMAVGRTTAQFWLEHGQKYHAKKITQAEALQRMKEAHERGNIITSWFKVATGGRTGVICSCCTCCCGALHTTRLMRRLKGGERYVNAARNEMFAASGYVVKVDRERCTGCGTCVTACVFEVSRLDDETRATVEEYDCMGCGLCVEKCPSGARELELNPEKGLPLDIDWIKQELT
jgi:ferredoxin